jgi:hypothetical protein
LKNTQKELLNSRTHWKKKLKQVARIMNDQKPDCRNVDYGATRIHETILITAGSSVEQSVL